MRYIVLALFVLLAIGCGRSSMPGSVSVAPSSSMTAEAQEEQKPVAEESKSWTDEEKRIVEIARKAVAENDAWVDRAEFRKPERQSDGSWNVLVVRTPHQPGGHRFISINAEGNVTEYGRGL